MYLLRHALVGIIIIRRYTDRNGLCAFPSFVLLPVVALHEPGDPRGGKYRLFGSLPQHWESISCMSDCRNSSKNRVPNTENRSETVPQAKSYHVGKPSKMTGPTSPDSAYRPVRNAIEAYIVYHLYFIQL